MRAQCGKMSLKNIKYLGKKKKKIFRDLILAILPTESFDLARHS